MKGHAMFTSNFERVGIIRPPLNAVTIARGHPRCKGGWKAHLAPGVEGRAYTALAPSWAMLKMTADGYDHEFARQLAALDPARVFAELGENAVLLCFCEKDQRCHRRIVAEWLEDALDVLIPELGQARDDTYTSMNENYPFFFGYEAKAAWVERKLATGPAPAEEPAPPTPLVPAPKSTPAPRRQISTRQTWNPATGQWEPAK